MSQTPDFDAIVVGAGPAGSTAAWRLAALGHRVLLLERGAYPGAKNLFGGMIYSLELARHFPRFVTEAPIERPVTRHATHFLAGDRSLNVDFSCDPFGQAPYNGFTAFRSRFDRWLSNEAVKAGAILAASTVVDDLIEKSGRVVGVVARREQGEIRAPITILADGILSLLGRKAGLIPDRPAAHYSLGVREVLALPPKTIEDRFQIDASGGCAALFVGDWPKGLQGGGFVYTNQESLSVGFVAQLQSLDARGLNVTDALDAFKRQPAVRRLIAGGERLEYGAHIVPEGGYAMRPKLVRDGLMLAGDAAALVLAAGVIYEGVHYAMHSGYLAAEAAHSALARGDTSARELAGYVRALDASYVTRNLRAFRHVPELIANPRMYSHLPHALCGIAEDFFRADAGGHAKLLPLLYRHLVRGQPLAALHDVWSTVRAMFL